MPATYRTVTEAYRDHASLHKWGWPPGDLVNEWYSEVCGLKGGIYTNLKAGQPVPEKYVRWLVALLTSPDEALSHLKTMKPPKRQAWLARSRAVLLEHMDECGVPEVNACLTDTILEHIAYPPVGGSVGLGKYVDYLYFKVECFAAVLRHNCEEWVSTCHSVAECADWIFTRVGEETSLAGRLQGPAKARAHAAAHMNITLETYRARLALWRDFNEWTVVSAIYKGVGPIGVCVALPLTDAAYEEVREGRLLPSACGPEELASPSLNIVLEAVAEHPQFVGRPDKNPTEALRVASVFQVSALVRAHKTKGKRTVRLLSFAGTPENERRLRSAGFVTYGKTLPIDGERPIKLYEFTVPINQLSTKSFLEAATLAHAGRHLPKEPPRHGH